LFCCNCSSSPKGTKNAVREGSSPSPSCCYVTPTKTRTRRQRPPSPPLAFCLSYYDNNNAGPNRVVCRPLAVVASPTTTPPLWRTNIDG
jgi:hypothetical protein